jgi:hypothetical protein
MSLRDVVAKIRDRLINNQQEPIVTDEAIYAEIMDQVQDVRVARSCQNCKYHNPLLCAVNPKRSLNYFAPNDCPH